jgi:hypothetical protein
MRLNAFVAAIAASALLLLPAETARADLKDALAGAVIGGIIAGAAQNSRAQQQRRTTTRSTSTRSSTARACGPQCQAHKEEQAALNHFGYDAGPVDGRPGPRTRGAISSFEAEMGFVPDGNLGPSERGFLVSSYHRANAQDFGTHYQSYQQGGPRALLRGYNQDRVAALRGPTQPVPQPGFPATTPPAAMPPAAMPNVAMAGAGAAVAAPAPLAPLSIAPVGQSMSARCTDVQRITLTNGGYIDAATPANASQALSEQFCLARDYATGNGQQLVSAVQGMTAADLQAYCSQIATAVAPALGTLPTQSAGAVAAQVGQIGAQSGMQPAQMVQAGEICMGIGYGNDDAAVALSGALFAAGGGQPSYGEMVGHHLREGFGTSANPTASRDWHIWAADQVDGGAPAAILPGQAGIRNAVIRGAHGAAAGTTQAATGTVAPVGALPALVLQPSGN